MFSVTPEIRKRLLFTDDKTQHDHVFMKMSCYIYQDPLFHLFNRFDGDITKELFSYKKANLVLTREKIFYNLHQAVFYKLRRKTIIAKKAILITKCVASNNYKMLQQF